MAKSTAPAAEIADSAANTTRLMTLTLCDGRRADARIGAPGRNRTRDQRFTKPLLYQLSYKGTALRLAHLPNQ